MWKVNWRVIGVVLAFALATAISGGAFAGLEFNFHPMDFIPAYVIYILVFGAQALILAHILTMRRPSTHACRRWGMVFLMAPVLLIPMLGSEDAGLDLIPMLAVFLLVGWVLSTFFVPLRIPTLIVVLTLIGVGVLPFGYCFPGALVIASMTFPRHRRIIELWRPARLPRIARRRAVTLIELLIVVAIIAISVPMLGHLMMTSTMAAHRNREWEEAISRAQDQIALLRAAPALPEVGTHPIDPRLPGAGPEPAKGELVISEGPEKALRLVTVRIPVGDPPRREVNFKVVLRAEKESVR